MKYLFYPGCSMHGSALEYQTSMLAVLKAMGAEIKELEDCRHPAYAEICFKPTSSYHKPVHTTESRITRQRLDVLLWQPVKFKNKLDELTLIAAVTGDDGFVMPPLAAACSLIVLIFSCLLALGVKKVAPTHNTSNAMPMIQVPFSSTSPAF